VNSLNSDRKPNSALAKAVQVIGIFAASDQPLSLAKVVEKSDLPRQTLHRILGQLVSIGLIIRAPRRDRYTIGPAMTRLATLSLMSLSLRPSVRTILDRLVEHTGETCQVGLLDQHEVVYIERSEGTSPLGLKLPVGSRIPVHCTALGKLLLAEQHKNVRRRIIHSTTLKRYTAKTVTDPDQLENLFTEIRSLGYSVNDEEWVEGMTAIAVPVRDDEKRAIMGLAVHAPLVRMPLSKALSYLPAIYESAEEIAKVWSLRGHGPHGDDRK
jgi:DNA-binding IclR family transcriptional regulator